MPITWQYVEGFHGRDVTILGPPTKGRRDVIIIEQAKSKNFTIEKENKSLNRYKKIKSLWIKEQKGIVVKFNLGKKEPQLKYKNIYNESIYILNGKTFIDGELFISCSNNTFASVSFLTLKVAEKKFKVIWSKVLKSIKC
jgi:hypothetical protein